MDHSLTFGTINSADYGIYISGEGVFDAPVRDVEVVEVPGRNGDILIDKGRFKNIQVKYPAINKEKDYATFRQRVNDFRNALASQVGYQRLTDTFNPDEYRLAAFYNGLEVSPIGQDTASNIEIIFDCKPQRFLKQGENR